MDTTVDENEEELLSALLVGFGKKFKRDFDLCEGIETSDNLNLHHNESVFLEDFPYTYLCVRVCQILWPFCIRRHCIVAS